MKVVIKIVALCWLFYVRSAFAAPVSVPDDAGHLVTLSAPARRVISLAPSLTEMIYEAGGGDRLIGAVEYSDYPPQALKVTRIGNNQQLDLERIATLKPDLALVWFHGNALREIEKLRTLGIPMLYLEPHDISDIPGAMLRIGQLLGTEAVARAAADRFRQKHERMRAAYAHRRPLRVFYEIAEKPLLTVNDKQIISDVMRVCGGINVFGKEAALVPQISTESVVAANPDVILAARIGGVGDADGATSGEGDARMRTWLAFKTVRAVRYHQIWMISEGPISRHGPRILDAVDAVCGALDQARRVYGETSAAPVPTRK